MRARFSPRQWFRDLKLRGKLLVVVLPLVVVPVIIVGSVVGYIGASQATLGITRSSEADLDHMAAFTVDLLSAHYQQFQVYRQDKRESFNRDLKALASIAWGIAESQNDQHRKSGIPLAAAQEEARKALLKVSVGPSGYLYAVDSKGVLQAHVAQQGENIYDAQDENGRFFIREMIEKAVRAQPGEVLFIVYPWRNEQLGDQKTRMKIAAYRYFPQWDWIIAASGYLDETAEDVAFERKSFEELKARLKEKKVGRSGYIYAVDGAGFFTIHPLSEGENHLDARDAEGKAFLREMREKKQGWIHYPWQNEGEREPRMKIARYVYFAPWDWVVAVGSYEDEFYEAANALRVRTFVSMLLLTTATCLVSILLVVIASRIITKPIQRMLEGIRQVKRGRFDQPVRVKSNDEMGELAATFNRMTEMIKSNREMETALAQQGKMASLGVLSSGVAHEINNPLGVILGYASYLEGKIPEDDPNYNYIHEIKRESKRCKKIVQNLLSYARTPRPALETIDLTLLLTEILNFAANHTDMHQVQIQRNFAEALPPVRADGDQLRQVAINLILNAGAAMPQGGVLTVSSRQVDSKFVEMEFCDSGVGMALEQLEQIFEPFYTTKARGTGLGLAITRQIIDFHHGRIKVHSHPGAGTTFVVTLPLDPEDDQS
jgi:two-component system NtrC family sensor kinase